MNRCILILCLFNVITYGQTEDITYYGGINSDAIISEDFEDFHISDWEKYGLGGLEGRVAIPLSEKDPEGSNLGILIGARIPFNERIDAFLEAQASLGEIAMGGLYAGVTYNIINSDKFKLGLTPKIGYTGGLAIFGEIQVIEGYTPPSYH